MTVPRLLEITDYWAKVPPLHEAFAGFVGALRPDARPTMTSGETGETEKAGDAASDDALVKDLMTMGFVIPAGVLEG